MAMTDPGGNFVNETDFVVFGNTWSVAGAVGVDLRFPGQMAQYESGLFYNWNRQCDPTIARYTQPDPLGLVDGPSRYAYVGNDPMQRTDITGTASSAGISLIPPDSPSGMGQSSEAACGADGGIDVALGDADCAGEARQCQLLCNRARFDSDMGEIWYGSMAKCMAGCMSQRCGGNPF